MWTVDRNLQIATTMEGFGPPERRLSVSRFFDEIDGHADWPVSAHARAQSGLETVAELDRRGTLYSARAAPLFRGDGLLVGSIGHVAEAKRRRCGSSAAPLARELEEAVEAIDRSLRVLREAGGGAANARAIDEIDVATRSVQSAAQRLRERGPNGDQ
jgi:hypothetical protein